LLAQTNICIRHYENIILVQKNKHVTNLKNPEPQVIAEAITTFALNNKTREKKKLWQHKRASIPTITMVGTYPTFYRISVTTQLSEAVLKGTYPPTRTRVLARVRRFSPVLHRGKYLGMQSLDNRVGFSHVWRPSNSSLGPKHRYYLSHAVVLLGAQSIIDAI
jgi:hypothetical protein